MAFEDEVKNQIGLPESNRLKYEALLPSSNEMGRTISAFCNTEGGILILGILNQNNKISVTGLSDDFQVNVVLRNTIAKLSPTPLIEHDFIYIQGKKLFAIKAEKSTQLISYNKIEYEIKAKKIQRLDSSNITTQNKSMPYKSNETLLNEVLKYLIENPGLINVNKHTVKETVLKNQISLSEAQELIEILRNSDIVKSYGSRFIGASIKTKPFFDEGGFIDPYPANSKNPLKSKNIFISYNWMNKTPAKNLYDFLVANGFSPSMDDHNLSYKGRISSFMESIRGADFAVLIISDEYLKSENCMTEVIHVLNDRDSAKKILPIRHEDVKIFKSADRIKYVEYWRSQVEDRESLLHGIDVTSAIEEIKKLKVAKRIYQDIGDFLSDIADMITTTIEEQEKTAYKSLLEYMEVN